MKESVSSILISTEDEFILQLRDNKPDIAQPGMISFFGGGVEDGEEPQDAIVREIEEELSIQLDKNDFSFLDSVIRTSSRSGNKHRAHLFVARGIKKEDLVLGEGEAIVFVKCDESLASLRLTDATREVLEKFKEQFYSEHSEFSF